MNKLLIVYAFFIIFFTASPACSLLCYQGHKAVNGVTPFSIKVVNCDDVLPINGPKQCAELKLSDSDGQEMWTEWGCIPHGISCEDYINKIIERRNMQYPLRQRCETCYSDVCNYGSGTYSNLSNIYRPSWATIVSMGILCAFLKLYN